MLALGVITVLSTWALFIYQSVTARSEALAASRSQHINLALVVSESLKQMTDRASAMARVIATEYPDPEALNRDDRLLSLLAEDPVFNRLSVYDTGGELRYSSHRHSARPQLGPWLAQARQHGERFGATPLLPRYDKSAPVGLPGWRLPFLVPVARPGTEQLEQLILLELDIGYLAGLLQHVVIGEGAFVQILGPDGHEWMRADSSGVMAADIDTPRVRPDLERRVSSGDRTFETADGERYQYVYVTRAANGFTVTLAQPHRAILASQTRTCYNQLALTLLMTLVVTAVTLWLIRALQRQQTVLDALQASEARNQQLIERLESEHARSRRIAAIDHLSGLLNRRQFLEEAGARLEQQRRARRLAALMFIDLDRFKSINDSLGHQVGDLLLQAVAGRIQRLLGTEDLAARFGGDEFVVLLAGERRERDIEDWARELARRLSSPYELDGTELKNSPSIGIAIAPRDGQALDELIRCADAAMYSAKKAGRGQYRFFDQSLNLRDVEQFHLEQSFSEALHNREFVLHFQPQVALDSLQVCGFEALVRWQHPRFGLVYPDRFVPLAESTGFIVPLGLEVVRLACEQIVAWREQGLPPQVVAVNASPVQLAQPDFSERVLAILAQHGVGPDRFDLEITETSILDSTALAHLEALRAAGMSLSLDDFGTGYSGLAHLEAVPVSKLKIDRSLVAKICNRHDDSPIVSSTIILAKRMNLSVVAEGVETREQVVHLTVAGCDIAQGYHFSRPMPAAEVPAFLAQFGRAETAT
jgi:diguanylate cyclase (GGDEF)-like protein